MDSLRRHLGSAAAGVATGAALTVALSALFAWVGPASLAHTGCPGAIFITGTTSADILRGDAGSPSTHDHFDSINGLAGNDDIEGYSCGDTVVGGNGRDELHGGFGNDDVFGGEGDDFESFGGGVFLGAGNDFGEGGAGSDSLVSNSAGGDTDILEGDDGNDILNSQDNDGRDTLRGGPHDTSLGDRCYPDAIPGGDGDSFTGCEFVSPG